MYNCLQSLIYNDNLKIIETTILVIYVDFDCKLKIICSPGGTLDVICDINVQST